MISVARGAQWTYSAADALVPGTLLLRCGALAESSGIKGRDRLDDDMIDQLAGGVDLNDVELSVHARVYGLLGHGAFAAACVRIVRRGGESRPREPLHVSTPDEIANGESAAGVVDADGFGVPYIALLRGVDLTDCILLTWSGHWCALRTSIQNPALRPGASHFASALAKHRYEVNRILGRSGVLSALRGGACSN